MYGQQAGFSLPTNVKRFYEGDLWSTYQFANAAPLASVLREVFQIQVGGAGQGFAAATPLSLAETNASEPARIASGLAYTVRSIGVEPYYPDAYAICGADLRNTTQNLVIRWRFLNTFVDVATVSIIGQMGGIFGSTADTGANEGGLGGSRIALNNGAATGFSYFELPVLLPANTTFGVQYQWGSSAVAVDGGENSSALNIRTHLVGVATSAVPEG